MPPTDPIAVLRASAEWQALIAAVRAAPEDPVARAVAADWLTEKLDDHPLARFVTAQLANAGRGLGADAFRAWYLAWPWEGPIRVEYAKTWVAGRSLQPRPEHAFREERIDAARGFVRLARVVAATWAEYGPALVRHPLAAITFVDLVDCRPEPGPGGGDMHWPDEAWYGPDGVTAAGWRPVPAAIREHLVTPTATVAPYKAISCDLSAACLKWAWATEPG